MTLRLAIYQGWLKDLQTCRPFWSSYRQTDREKVVPKNPLCISTGVLKKGNNLTKCSEFLAGWLQQYTSITLRALNTYPISIRVDATKTNTSVNLSAVHTLCNKNMYILYHTCVQLKKSLKTFPHINLTHG